MAQTPSGTWSLYPPEATVYTAAVQQPINTDGASTFKSTGKAVIPIKFSLATSAGPVIFQSIGGDLDLANGYCFLSLLLQARRSSSRTSRT
jgi:hypothetical protein